jgi:hypothetical protein
VLRCIELAPRQAGIRRPQANIRQFAWSSNALNGVCIHDNNLIVMIHRATLVLAPGR